MSATVAVISKVYICSGSLLIVVVVLWGPKGIVGLHAIDEGRSFIHRSNPYSRHVCGKAGNHSGADLLRIHLMRLLQDGSLQQTQSLLNKLLFVTFFGIFPFTIERVSNSCLHLLQVSKRGKISGEIFIPRNGGSGYRL